MRYLVVFAVVFILFQLLGTVGFFAHLVVPGEALIDATTGQFRQDLVMTMYLKTVFPEAVFTFVSIVLLAAATSTLDGLLVSISTITANDLVLNVIGRRKREHLTEAQQMAFALRVSHVVLIVIAVAAFLVNLQPPKLLGIFGQVGVYGLAAATTIPLLLGISFRDILVSLAWFGSITALITIPTTMIAARILTGLALKRGR